MNTHKILLVDDDISMQVFLKNVLEKDGFSVTLASSGEEALKLLPDIRPDIVLMDVTMPPGMSGFEACKIIRSNPENTYLPIMVVTGLEDVASINKAYVVGASDFTTKPINPALIGHRIRYVIRSSSNAINLKKAEKDILMLNENLEKLVQKRTAELKKTTENLQIALDDLKNTQAQLIESAKIASLDQVVYGIAHEISTPLGIAISAISYFQHELDGLNKLLTKKYGADEDVTSSIKLSLEAKNLVENNLHRASLLLRTFRNLTTDKKSTSKTEFEIKPFLDELVHSVKTKLDQVKTEVIIDSPNDLTIISYPDVFLEVISALILNSMQHGFDGEKPGKIKISAKKLNSNIEITYEDNGKGFEKDSEKKIFEPFYTTKRGEGHPGLGLNIAYNFVKQTLKGTISYSPPEEGCTGVKFKITLPIQ